MKTEKCDQLEHGQLPDPEGQALDDLRGRVDELERMLRELAEEKLSLRQGR
jgi:serine O-acetyltransferase